MTPSIPSAIEPALTALTGSLVSRLPKIVCVILYGSAARGLYQPTVSDVNLLIVVPTADLPTLALLRSTLAGDHSLRLSPYLLASGELLRVAEAFPTRILDMKRGYVVLHGEDVLAGVSIDHASLAVRTRQELLNLLLRLRHSLLWSDEEAALQKDLRVFYPSFTKTLRTVYYLKTGQHIDDRGELFAVASRMLGFSGEIFEQLLAWRQGRVALQGKDFREGIEALFHALEKVAAAETAHD